MNSQEKSNNSIIATRKSLPRATKAPAFTCETSRNGLKMTLRSVPMSYPNNSTLIQEQEQILNGGKKTTRINSTITRSTRESEITAEEMGLVSVKSKSKKASLRKRKPVNYKEENLLAKVPDDYFYVLKVGSPSFVDKKTPTKKSNPNGTPVKIKTPANPLLRKVKDVPIDQEMRILRKRDPIKSPHKMPSQVKGEKFLRSAEKNKMSDKSDNCDSPRTPLRRTPRKVLVAENKVETPKKLTKKVNKKSTADSEQSTTDDTSTTIISDASSTEDDSMVIKKHEPSTSRMTTRKRPIEANHNESTPLKKSTSSLSNGKIEFHSKKFRGAVVVENVLSNTNPEEYFTAENRIKYAKAVTGQPVMNDMRKGKAMKPRKGQRGTGGRKVTLAQKPTYAISVTKEATKVASQHNLSFDSSKHPDECNNLLKNKIEADFPRWLYLLRGGFSIMLYGYGSKLAVFQSFKDFLEDGYLTVSINGLYPNLNAKKFLTDFCKSLDLEEPVHIVGTNIQLIAEDVYNALKDEHHEDVFLLVKNLDTLAVRHSSLLAALSTLARVNFIHIIASSDHVNAFMGVNQTQTIHFNFAWIDCTTFIPYEDELTWKPEVFGNDKEANTGKNALEHVLQSLTANARKAFSMLAALQLGKIKALSKSKAHTFAGIEFSELTRKCREAFVAHSAAAVNTLLVEFIDHKLIRQTGKTKSTNNFLIIDLDVGTLEEVLKTIN